MTSLNLDKSGFLLLCITNSSGMRYLEAFPQDPKNTVQPSLKSLIHRQDQVWYFQRADSKSFFVFCNTKSKGKCYLVYENDELQIKPVSDSLVPSQFYVEHHQSGQFSRIYCFDDGNERKYLEAYPKVNLIKAKEAAMTSDQHWIFISVASM